MAKLSERLQGYWQSYWQNISLTRADTRAEGRSPAPEKPDVIDLDSKPDQSEIANELEAQIEADLETQQKTRIAQIFQRMVQGVKPDDLERIKQHLGEMRRGPIKEIWGKVQSLAQMAKDPHVPWQSKAVAIAALIYLISPFDAVPDVIPFVGLADDVAVIAAVVSTLAVELEKYMTRQAEKQAEIEIKKQTEIVRITLLGSIAAAAIAIIVKLILNALA